MESTAKIMNATFKIWRGDSNGGEFRNYMTEVAEGMVVLDAIHDIQRTQAPNLACRWNCKAGKCGSCSAEVNGMPKLMCMTRLSELPLEKPVTVEPIKAFPILKDLVTDVSWNFQVKKKSNHLSRARPMRPMAHGECSKKTSIACRNFGNALNVFFARMFVTCCATTRCTRNLSGRAF